MSKGNYVVAAELEKNIVNSFMVKIEKGKMFEINSDNLKDSTPSLSSN